MSGRLTKADKGVGTSCAVHLGPVQLVELLGELIEVRKGHLARVRLVCDNQVDHAARDEVAEPTKKANIESKVSETQST